MRKELKHIIIALCGAITVVSCSKESPIIDNEVNVPVEEAPEVKTITISATLSEALTKVAMDPTFEGVKPTGMSLTWAEGDKIRVYDADNSENYADFEISEECIGKKVGTFTGTAIEAEKYNITVLNGEFDYNNQNQPADRATTGLKYFAYANGVEDYTSIQFTEYSSVLAITAKMPDGVAKAICSVELKANNPIFCGKNTLTITLNEKGDAEEDGILHFFATLPAGNQGIPEGTTLVAHFNAPDTDHTIYTRYIELGGQTLTANKLNTININAVESDTHAGVKDCNGSEANPYLIGDKYQMDAIHDKLSDTKTYYKMVDDIDMSGITWAPLNSGVDKKIHFNGNNHTLSNIATGDPVDYQSIFGCLSGTVENLIIDNAQIQPGSKNAAVLASHLGNTNSKEPAKVNNVTIKNSKVTDASGSNTGILAALVEYDGAEISNVTIENCVVSSQKYAAGLIATTSNSATITNCTVSGTNVSGSLTSGVVGHLNSKAVMTGCLYTGGIITASSRYSGGMIASAGNLETTISDCHVTNATIDASNVTIDARCGGFAGQIQQNVKVTGCTVGSEEKKVIVNLGQPAYEGKADKDIRHLAGGFVGCGYGAFTECKTYATITSTNTVKTAQLCLGGFVGYHQYKTITGCHADVDMENITGSYVGGFCGYNVANNIEDCTQTGKITGHNYIGGFVGVMADGEMINCTSAGSVEAETAVGGFAGTVLKGKVKGSRTNTNTQSTCKASVTVTGTTYVGGFVGYAKGGAFECCDSQGVVAASGTYIGGFVGRSSGNLNYSHCRYYGKQVETSSTDSNVYVGGFCGGIYEAFTGSFSKCWVSAGGDQTIVKSTKNKPRVGGFIGSVGSNTNNGVDNTGIIEKCRVHRTAVYGGTYTGGFAGVSYANISQCCATSASKHGLVKSVGNSVGGFAGYQQFNNISNCYTTLSSVEGNNYVGGMVGNSKSTNFAECYVGEVTITCGANLKKGAFLGYAEYGNQERCISWVGSGWIGENKEGKETTTTQCHRKQNDDGKYVSTYAASYNWDTAIWNVDDFSNTNSNNFGLRETETIMPLN